MKNLIIYHNPKCSKSRNTLKILNSENLNPQVILYLEKKLYPSDLKSLLIKLNISAKQLLRSTEKEYKDKNLGKENLSENEIIKIMLNCPKLIQRPIVVNGSKAIIARPPEKVYEII